MADSNVIQRVRTILGDVPIDYNALVNKPETTKTLVLSNVKSGDFADAKAVSIELQNITKKIENIQTSNSILKNNGITSSTNVMKDIGDINSKINSLAGDTSDIISNADLKKILDANKLTAATNITKTVTNLQSNVTNVTNRVSVLESSKTETSGFTATKITNWNSVSSLPDGWYYSLSNTASTDGSPGTISGLSYYFGEIHSFTVDSTKYVREAVRAFKSNNTDVQLSFERISLNGGNSWGEWKEVTPITQSITISEFTSLINEIDK